MSEIRLEASRLTEAFITCDADAVPRAGQYLWASDLDDREAAQGVPIFLAESSTQGFWCAPAIPREWRPGTKLDLAGPLGHGFHLPREVQRLGLVALGETVSRLMPLLEPPVASHRSTTLFTDLPLPKIPSSLEAYPLASLADSLDWPDFLAIDLPLQSLPDLRRVLGLSMGEIFSCPTQVLVTTPMPCAGLAQCGVCALQTRRGWKLTCVDGPVYDLQQLIW